MKSGKTDKSDLTILVIEDDELVRSFLAGALQKLGMHVVLAHAPDEGIEKFHSACPDLVLIDIHLPKAKSFSILAELAELAPDLPLIVLAERGNKADLMKALRLGVSDYLILPLADEAMLEHSIASSMRRSRLTEENSRIRIKLEQINAELEQRIEVFQQDQQAGRHVQINMLPIPPQQISRYTFNHKVIPSLYLSGDTVDYKQVSRHEVLFYIADVSGHGSSSAFITILFRFRVEQMRRDYLRGRFAGEFTPSHILEILNHDMLASGLDKHVTVIMGLLNDLENTLTYSVAGHHPLPIMYTDAKAAEFPVTKNSFPIGIFNEATYFDERIPLPEKFALFLFSDGILEHIKADSLLEKEAKLVQAVADCQGDFNQLKIVLNLQKSINVPDDIAVMSVTSE